MRRRKYSIPDASFAALAGIAVEVPNSSPEKIWSCRDKHSGGPVLCPTLGGGFRGSGQPFGGARRAFQAAQERSEPRQLRQSIGDCFAMSCFVPVDRDAGGWRRLRAELQRAGGRGHRRAWNADSQRDLGSNRGARARLGARTTCQKLRSWAPARPAETVHATVTFKELVADRV
jgi:hypothetical protein